MAKNIKDLLKGSIKRAGIKRQVQAALVVEQADIVILEIFGKQRIAVIKTAWFKDNCLTIACLNSSAAQEIRLVENIIMNRINKHFEQNIVKQIKYIF